MLDGLLSILTSSGLGAIVGVAGSWLTKREERENIKLKLSHDREMAKIRKEEASLEFKHELSMADKKLERTKREGEIQKEVGEIKAFAESLEEQKKNYGIRFVDAIRGLMRPLITAYLMAIATYVVLKIGALVGGVEGAFTSDEIVSMYKDVIANIMFLVVTAVTWWFGTRPSSKQAKGTG